MQFPKTVSSIAGFPSNKNQRTWREQYSSLGEKQGKKHRKNGLLNFGVKIGSFLTKSFLNFFLFLRC